MAHVKQHDPDDYVIATGESHAVHEFLGEAFSYVGLDWHELVEDRPKILPSCRGGLLTGDPSKAKQKLGWEPKTKFKELVRLMVDADMETASKEAHMNGYQSLNRTRRASLVDGSTIVRSLKDTLTTLTPSGSLYLG